MIGGGDEQKPIVVVPPPEPPEPWYQSPLAQTALGFLGMLVIALVGWRYTRRRK